MRIVKEPFIHFLLIGAVIFALSLLKSGKPEKLDTRIFVDKETVQSITDRINKRFGNKLSREEFKEKAEKALAEIIKQEILYREGLAINLDRNDMVIKKRVAYKMNLVAVEKANRPDITPEEIKKYYNENKERYTVPRKVTFRQILFSSKKRGDQAAIDCNKVLERVLAGELKDFKEIQTLGDETNMTAMVRSARSSRIERTYGAEFARNIEAINKKGWIGGVTSKEGVHLVEIIKIVPAQLKSIDEVRARIEATLGSLRDQKTYDDFYEQAQKKYTIEMEKEF